MEEGFGILVFSIKVDLYGIEKRRYYSRKCKGKIKSYSI